MDLFEWYFLRAGEFDIFVPRRDVTITFEDITADAVRYAGEGRQPFNRFLESFYNAAGEEKLLFLKHFFYVPGRRDWIAGLFFICGYDSSKRSQGVHE